MAAILLAVLVPAGGVIMGFWTPLEQLATLDDSASGGNGRESAQTESESAQTSQSRLMSAATNQVPPPPIGSVPMLRKHSPWKALAIGCGALVLMGFVLLLAVGSIFWLRLKNEAVSMSQQRMQRMHQQQMAGPQAEVVSIEQVLSNSAIPTSGLAGTNSP